MANNNALTVARIDDYRESIGIISDIEIRRIRSLFSKATFICPDELKDIFISNYLGSDGKDQFKDMWFFSDNYVIEMLNFNTQAIDKLDICSINKNIGIVTVEATNFEFSKQAIGESKLHIIFYTNGIFNCDIIASGINCDMLTHIFTTYIKNNVCKGNFVNIEE